MLNPSKTKNKTDLSINTFMHKLTHFGPDFKETVIEFHHNNMLGNILFQSNFDRLPQQRPLIMATEFLFK